MRIENENEFHLTYGYFGVMVPPVSVEICFTYYQP